MITLFIIILTCVISIAAFRNNALANKLIFYPPAVRKGEWYRLFTYGVLHADSTHLFFNMFTLYLFGSCIEKICRATLGIRAGSVCFILLYVSALPLSILPTYLKHKNDAYYRSLGASGAVSAVVFAYILIHPMNFMGILFIPIMLPAFIFGLIYIALSFYLDKNRPGGINHSAHIAGGIYGIMFMTVSFATLADWNLLASFLDRIHINSLNDLIYIGY